METSTTAVAFTTSGRQGASHSAPYALIEPAPGFAEQDPQVIVAAVHTCVREFVAATSGQVRGLWFSSAMHSLMGLDRHGDPLTPSITWADSRARPQAERNQAALRALELHKRTGTPAHPMAPLSKLIWFSEQEPALFARVRHWVGVKDYVLLRMCDELVTDHSLASGSGLLDIGRLRWDPQALGLAGINATQLPELVSSSTVLPRLSAEAVTATGLQAATKVVVDAADEP